MDIERLSRYLYLAADRKHEFGRFDCCRFVAEALLAGWNRDFRAELGYHDRKSAIARLRASGGLYEALIQVFGPDRPASELEPGDIAWLTDSETRHKAIGLVLPECVVVKSRASIVRLPRDYHRTGWASDGRLR